MTEKLALTVVEACKLVGIGRTKGYELCATGQWPTIRIGRAVRVPVDGLKRWIAEQADGQPVLTRGMTNRV